MRDYNVECQISKFFNAVSDENYTKLRYFRFSVEFTKMYAHCSKSDVFRYPLIYHYLFQRHKSAQYDYRSQFALIDVSKAFIAILVLACSSTRKHIYAIISLTNVSAECMIWTDTYTYSYFRWALTIWNLVGLFILSTERVEDNKNNYMSVHTGFAVQPFICDIGGSNLCWVSWIYGQWIFVKYLANCKKMKHYSRIHISSVGNIKWQLIALNLGNR